MRVRMLTSVAGERDGTVYCYEAGEEYDLDPKEARAFVSAPEGSPRAEPVAVTPSGRKGARGRGVETR